MNIVIEGADGTGKSTLADAIAAKLFRMVQRSEGPPRSQEEINERTRRYLSMDAVLFDRHPCISNKFYDNYRDKTMPVAPTLITHFYTMENLFIYCEPPQAQVVDHVLKPHDDEAHIRLLEAHRIDILADYRLWAVRHANIIYRIGDDMKRTVDMVKACLIG